MKNIGGKSLAYLGLNSTLLWVLCSVNLALGLKNDGCVIRDSNNFRDIYIKEGSQLQTKVYQYDEGATTLLVSLCSPIPKETLIKYNCDTNFDYFYARVETTIEQQQTIRVCANQVTLKSVTKCLYDKKTGVYTF